MRLHRLDVEGFGPFRTRQSVDFDAFADDGIFLIAGRTGAGKSSILDAVCFALYGSVPRYDGGEKRLRSDHCEPDDISEVAVEFSTPSGRFRVTRSPEYLRPAKRGGGMTKQPSAVSLDEFVDEVWVGRAARAVDVAGELEQILQLSREQFLQVILLAQNRFADFLLADSRERQRLLRRLFGTERFEDYQQRFDERRRASKEALGGREAAVEARLEEGERLVVEHELDATPSPSSSATAGADDGADDGGDLPDGVAPDAPDRRGVEASGDAGAEAGSDVGADSGGSAAASDQGVAAAIADPHSTQGRLDALRRAVARAEYRADHLREVQAVAEEELAQTERAVRTAREERQAQLDRDRARAALADLDARADEVGEQRGRLHRAQAAEALRTAMAAAERASTAQRTAEERAALTREAWAELGTDDVAEEPAALRDWAERLVRDSGAWERAAELEHGANERTAAVRVAAEAAETAEQAVTEIEEQRAALPAVIAQLTARREEAHRHGDRSESLGAVRDEAAVRRDAALQAEQLEAEVRAAEQRLTEATDRHTAAQTALGELRRRRIEGFAGELATGLVPGEPCVVCGSTEHPRPAEHADPVSADDIAAAEQVRDAAAAAERDASVAASALHTEHAAAAARAGGLSASAADDALAQAEAAHTAAVEAASRAEALDAELTAETARAAAIDGRLAAAATSAAAARERAEGAQERFNADEAVIAAARGEHDTVAGRLAAASARITAAQALAAALEELAARTAGAAEAVAERDDGLAASDFADAAEAQQALLSDAERTRLDAQIVAHAAQREKERALLLELELRALPEEPVALEAAEQAAADARTRWMAAVDATGRADAIAQRLGDLTRSAAPEHERSAVQAAHHEVLQNLADTVAGRGQNTHRMALETFVLAAELEEIVAAANLRLGDMSAGRYQLRHSDERAARNAASGLGIVVFDGFTGQTRPARSLSGGETFLSSLALALGLAEVVTARAGGIRLDTLFIDEGFGSLDADTLEVAMRTLDELRQGGRTVGVISHVEAMQEQIPAQLTVRTTVRGDSVIDL